jgi:uroporphyrin-III C-methyltransferase / precorrin-2 dehydrogenase / sirohydrochlorin ferrochelatase
MILERETQQDTERNADLRSSSAAVLSTQRAGLRSRPYYPMMLDLDGRTAVVIGGGAIATQKTRELVAARASVRVVSPDVSAELIEMARAGSLTIERRPYRNGDLAGAAIAIAATDDGYVNGSIWEEACTRNVPLNAVDDVEHCHFIAPSVHRTGDITVTVSTAGQCPALAVRLRERLSALVRREHAEFARIAGSLRVEIARRVPDIGARRRLWYRIVDSDAIHDIRDNHLASARATIDALIREAEAGSSSDARPYPRTPGHEQDEHNEHGHVFLVGAGPGDPGLITVRGLDLLRTANVVVHDRLVSGELLARAHPAARLIPVGKHGHGTSTPQEEINDLLVREARAGNRVVRLKGGDPFVFGRGAEECAALRAARVPFDVVPGISSAIAVPGAAGIPLTHRTIASGFAVVTGHLCNDPSGAGGDIHDLDWSALARIPTLVVLMGLRAMPSIVERLVTNGRAMDTPAAVISRGTLADQQVVLGTLRSIVADVANARIQQPATLVVGDVARLAEVPAPTATTQEILV